MASEKAKISGRTLLETCATLGIFALVSAVSAPQFRVIHERLAVKEAALALGDLISQLTTLARIHQSDLVLRSIGRQVVLATRTTPTRKLRTIPIQRDLSLRINTAEQKIFAYPTNTLSPGRIVISNGVRECALIISLRGRVRSVC